MNNWSKKNHETLNMTNESAMTSTSVCDEIHPVRSLVENDQCLTAEIKPGAAVKSYQKYT